MKYKLIIFDMDGTILDTLQDLADSLNYALRLNSCPERSIDEVRRFVGNGIRNLIVRSVPDGAENELIEKIFADFMPHYKQHCADKTRPYDGVIELIKRLRCAGCKTAVVSNKADSAVQELCEEYFTGLFDVSVGEQEGIARKPAPDMVNIVLDRLSVPRGDAVYIGDSEVDVATARNSELDLIAVEWGFRGRETLLSLGAVQIAASPREVYDFLNI